MIARAWAFAWLVLATGILGGCQRSSANAPPPRFEDRPTAKAAPVVDASFMPSLHVLRNDPRLTQARDLERSKDFAGAAKAVVAARPADLPPLERCAWDYLEGRLFFAANDGTSAEAAFGRAKDEACPLAGYAHLRLSQSLARRGRADEAIAEAKLVPETLAAVDEATMVLAESFSQKGDRGAALPLWRAWLAKNPYGPRWVDTSIRIATALLDGLDGPPESQPQKSSASKSPAREAFDLATKVIVEAPKLSGDVGAEAVRARAATVLRSNDPTFRADLDDDQRVKQAQALLDGNEATKALDAASRLVASTKSPSTACRASILRAKAQAKASSKSGSKSNTDKGDGWPEAIAACEKDDELLPTALYNGAKARGGKDPKSAIAWYERLESAYPTHRLADDARLRGALLVGQSTDEGHEDRAEQMLLTLADTYPSGDMRTEALFRGALGKMQRGDWAAAAPILDRIVELAPDDMPSGTVSATAGRAAYFRARAAGMAGDAEDEKARLTAIVEKYPVAYYMLLAYARLARIDAAHAARTLKAAEDRESSDPFPSRAHPVFSSPEAVRAVRLLEVGEIDAARREFAASGALADDADPEVVWTIGALYNEAGAPELGHAFSRTRLTDYLSHYPKGRWRIPWEVAYPRAFEPLVVKACAENALPRPFAWGIMREESSFMAEVKSPANAFGLMQLIVPTAKWVAAGTPYGSDEASLKQPEVSIQLGTRLLGKLRAKHGHPALAIGAYNAGSGAVDRWMKARGTEDLDLFVELVPYDETRNYIKRVLASQAAYAYLYDPASLGDWLGLSFRLAPQ